MSQNYLQLQIIVSPCTDEHISTVALLYMYKMCLLDCVIIVAASASSVRYMNVLLSTVGLVLKVILVYGSANTSTKC